MTFARLLEIVGDEPVFETGLLLAGDANPEAVRLQLSRWTKDGRLNKIRRGLYALSAPYRKTAPHPFLVANRLVRASYVSCESALELYGLIPEHTPVVVSVTSTRPGLRETPLGTYQFRHVKRELFGDYTLFDLGNGQQAFVAAPEKALLDLVYLQAGGDEIDYLNELRLQGLAELDRDRLRQIADESGKRKLVRASDHIIELADQEAAEYRPL